MPVICSETVEIEEGSLFQTSTTNTPQEPPKRKKNRNVADNQRCTRNDFLAVTESNAQAMKMLTEISKTQAEATRIQAEASKIQAEAFLLFAQAANKIGDALLKIADKI